MRKNIKWIRMDGDTDMQERADIVDMFQNDDVYKVFLITTRTGGLGLNLTAATRVIIFDPDWNPAIDCQAIDRTYRIGQTKDVLVYRLITCGTVEEQIYRRQVSKMGLLKIMTSKTVKQARYFAKSD